MSAKDPITVEELAEAFQELSFPERVKLVSLLPENWFGKIPTKLDKAEKKALDIASEKENEGRAIFHSWEEVEEYVKNY